MPDLRSFEPARSFDDIADMVHAALDAYYHKNYLPLLRTADDDVVFIGAGPDVVRGKRELTWACGQDIPTPSFHMKNAYFDVQPMPAGVDPGEAELAVVTGFYDLFSEGDKPMLTAVHQRLTVLLRRKEGVWMSFYVHSSNEWSELVDDEVFPVQISSQTYQYVRRIIEQSERGLVSGPRPGPVVIESKGTVQTVDPSELIYVRATAKTCEAHMAGRTVTLPCSISKMAAELEGSQFMRVHRSYLVNADYVRGLEGDELALKDGERIPVPVRRRAEVRDWVIATAAAREVGSRD